MGKSWFATGLSVAACFFFLVACSGDTGKGTQSASSAQPGRGSAACQNWQNAVCGWASKCGVSTSACDQAKGILCKSDELASSCAMGIASAACAAPPTGCDLIDLADTAAAVSMCQSYMSSACDALLRCNIETDKAACMNKLTSTQDCSRVAGVGLGYEKCLDDLAHAACNQLLPPSCSGVFFETR